MQRNVKLTLLVIFTIGMVWTAVMSWHIYKLTRLISSASDMLSNGIEHLAPSEGLKLINDANYHLTAFEAGFRFTYPILRVFSGLPYIGRYSGQIEPLLLFSTYTIQSINLVVQSFAPEYLAVDSTNEITNSTQKILFIFENNQDNINQAIWKIQKADQMRSQIAPQLLPEKIRSKYLLFDGNFALIKSGISGLPILPILLGADTPYRFLLIAQNRDELRPTGGFISGIGIMEFSQGKITSFELGDSYRVDNFSKPYPPPPEPLQRLMLAGYWVTRDANWSPDFPTAARQIQSLYTLSTDQETDAVIAFDQKAVSAILEEIGSLQLNGFSDPITTNNVENYMLQSWAPNPSVGLTLEWWEHRKDFMGQLGKAILQKIFEISEPRDLVKVSRRLVDLIETGHVLIYFSQPKIQDLLVQAGLDHGLHIGTGDYLMLVDTNFGFNKVDSMIKRSLEYKLDLSNLDQPRATIHVRYENTVTKEIPCKHESTYGEGTVEDMRNRCYWDYWRIYVLSGSVLYNTQVKPISGNLLLSGESWNEVERYEGEGGLQVLAGVVVVSPNQSEGFSLSLLLPKQIIKITRDGEIQYSLYLKKQPGLDVLLVQFDVQVPDGYTLVFTSPSSGWSRLPDNVWKWSGNIIRDQQFSFALIQDQIH